MKQVLSHLLSLVLILLVTGNSLAASEIQPEIPDSTKIQILNTSDGSRYIGRVVSVSDKEIRFETKLGIATIPLKTITDIQEVPIASMVKGRHWFRNANTTRLFFAPTGRMLKQARVIFPTTT